MADCSCNNFPSGLGNVTFGANVGIGRTDPQARLHVSDSLMVGSLPPGSRQALEFSEANADLYIGSQYQDGNIFVRNMAGTSNIQLNGNDGSATLMGNATVMGNATLMGNVGIGTTNPEAQLHVADSVKIGSSFVVGSYPPGSRQALEFSEANAGLYIGSQYQDGNIFVRNMAGTPQIQLNGNDGSIRANGTLYSGSRAVANSNGCLYA